MTSGSGQPLPVTVNPANNRIIGYTYDNNGNLTAIPSSMTATYDIENRMVSALAIYADAPGLVSPFHRIGFGPILAAIFVANFTLQVSVTSGNQTVDCPTVYWQAWEIWQEGIPS